MSKTKPEKYEITDKEDADGKVIIEVGPAIEIIEEEVKPQNKKEPKSTMYQYTINLKDGNVFIICSKNLLKEHKEKIWIKDCFEEEIIEDSFLGFDISVSYKKNIGHYEWDSNLEWTSYIEVIPIPEWVSLSKQDAEEQLSIQKNQLIAKIDAMQKEGKIKIQKK